MSLPTRIKNVRYKVAGKYAYKGDLIVTQGVLYYFPHTDLIQQRINRTVDAMAFAAGGLTGDFIRDLGLTDSDNGAKAMLNSKASASMLQERLDAYIANIKKERSSVTLSTYLPVPLRYARAEVKNLSLTFMGSVSFEAQYDSHFYNIGVTRKGLLRSALADAGFIKR